MPLEDRAADTWEPLIAVADLAGAEWPARGRHAAEALTAEHDGAAPTSDRVRLLADCRTAFGSHDAIPTVVLLERLKADPEAPWADYGSTGLTPMKLGALLREYDIRSLNIRFAPPIGQAKRYVRADFADAWQRYCPPLDVPEPSQPSQTSPPSSTLGRLSRVGRLKTSHGSTGTAQDVPAPQAVPSATSDATPGTAGTATPHLYLTGGAA